MHPGAWEFWQLHQISKVRFRVAARLNEIDEAGLARLKFACRKPSAKKFIAQPDTIGVDHVALAVFGNLANAAIKIEFP
jgi:hypothetical protein